jgi:hypothetical protein
MLTSKNAQSTHRKLANVPPTGAPNAVATPTAQADVRRPKRMESFYHYTRCNTITHTQTHTHTHTHAHTQYKNTPSRESARSRIAVGKFNELKRIHHSPNQQKKHPPFVFF